MDVGVGKAEAAGIRGGAHIDGVRHFFVHFHIQLRQNVPDDLGTGGRLRIHQRLGGEFPVAAVVVDAQIHTVSQIRMGSGEHMILGHIHRHDQIAVAGLLHGQSLEQGRQLRGDFRIVENAGILADGAQGQAQSRGGAHGVAVRAAVGQDAVIVVFVEVIRDLSSRQKHRLSLPPCPAN